MKFLLLSPKPHKQNFGEIFVFDFLFQKLRFKNLDIELVNKNWSKKKSQIKAQLIKLKTSQMMLVNRQIAHQSARRRLIRITLGHPRIRLTISISN